MLDKRLIFGSYKESKGLFTVAASEMLHHTAIIGQSGSGKSFAITRILEELVLRTRARVVIIDPNGDFSQFHQPQNADFWNTGPQSGSLKDVHARTSPALTSYDQASSFAERWNSRRFQFVTAGRKNWRPYRSGANSAPLLLHWKWLGHEQDFLLNLDPTLYPKVYQGNATCHHYIDDNDSQYPQGFSLKDLEDVAGTFAQKNVVLAAYPEAATLSETDWLAVRLQYRQLRKRFWRLWIANKLKGEYKAPSDLSNYIYNGFNGVDPWQVCVAGLSGLDDDHMLLAANVTLYTCWQNAVGGWQRARARLEEEMAEKSEAEAEEIGIERDPVEAMEETQASIETPVSSSETWQDHRVPTFIVIDEAHHFAPEENSNSLQARVSDRIAMIAAEGRKYGLFLLLATQRPQKLRKGLLAEFENACLLRIQSKIERAHAHQQLAGIGSDTIDLIQNLGAGQALMSGRWVEGAPICQFAPSRSVVGGGGIDRAYWQEAPL